MSLLTEAPWALADLGGEGVLGLSLVFTELDQPHAAGVTPLIHTNFSRHTGVYALLAFAFLQSGHRLGSFIKWILAKQKARNKNNSFSGLG